MRILKGINPLIASVLLIAFTMAVAAVLVVWITGFTQQQTETVGQRGEQQTICSFSTLAIDKDDVSILGNNVNVTVAYSTGTETLNITGINVRDVNGVTYVNATPVNAVNDETSRNWAPGTQRKFVNYVLANGTALPAGLAWKEVRVTALCQSKIVVVGTVTNL